MNATDRFVSKSQPLGRPIAGVQILVHRSGWLLLPLLLLLTPLVLAPFSLPAHLGSTLLLIIVLGGAVFAQVAAQVFIARRLGTDAAKLLLFPFGPLLADGVHTLSRSRRLAVWLAGSLVNVLGGSLLRSSEEPLLEASGRLLHAYGWFSLAPAYPLAGGLILRELLCFMGCGDTEADRRTLEVSRLCLCVLAALALLTLALPVFYALFVLWVVGHLALMPGIDLAGVRATSLQWFRERWAWLRRHLGGSVKLAFLVAFCCGSTVGQADPADWPAPSPAQLIAALQAAEPKGCALESNYLALTARLANLEHRLDETTALVANTTAAQSGTDQNVSSLAAKLAAAEEALNDEIKRCRGETTSSIDRLILSDRALALGDRKTWRFFGVLTGLNLLGLAAAGLVAGCLYRRTQELAVRVKKVPEDGSLTQAFATPATEPLSSGPRTPAAKPEGAPADKYATAPRPLFQ